MKYKIYLQVITSVILLSLLVFIFVSIYDSSKYDGMFWGSAPDGIYDVHYHGEQIVNGTITFPACEHYPGQLHLYWKSNDVFNDGIGWYKVALIENEIVGAWRIYR